MKMAPLQIIYRLFPSLCSFTRGYSLCYKWHPWSTMHRICTSISMSPWNWQGEWICRAVEPLLMYLGHFVGCQAGQLQICWVRPYLVQVAPVRKRNMQERSAGNIDSFPWSSAAATCYEYCCYSTSPWRNEDEMTLAFVHEGLDFPMKAATFWPCHMQPMQLVPVGMLSLWKATPWRRARCVAQTLSAGANKSGSAEVL